jgi:hypothetical protein
MVGDTRNQNRKPMDVPLQLPKGYLQWGLVLRKAVWREE